MFDIYIHKYIHHHVPLFFLNNLLSLLLFLSGSLSLSLFFPSAKEVVFSVRFVSLSVCQQDYAKTAGPIFMQLVGRV